jgi:hypothetical protein
MKVFFLLLFLLFFFISFHYLPFFFSLETIRTNDLAIWRFRCDNDDSINGDGIGELLGMRYVFYYYLRYLFIYFFFNTYHFVSLGIIQSCDFGVIMVTSLLLMAILVGMHSHQYILLGHEQKISWLSDLPTLRFSQSQKKFLVFL